MSRTVALGLPLMLLCLTGAKCDSFTDKPAEKLTIPAAASLDQIVISWKGDPFARDEEKIVITDRETIERVVALLNRLNSDWHKPWDTFPGPQYSISLQQKGKHVKSLWVGGNWLGGRDIDDAKHNQLRSLTAKDRKELLDLLGIKEKATPKQ
jgi:hypothetical protein